MSLLQLSDDDIALLRWTCELFFVPESPIYFIDAEAREPADFAGTYQDMVRRGVLDDANFRLTDMALNRLAPLTECDARLVLVTPAERGGRPRVRDFYLLDEIAVEYEDVDRVHTVGPDQDNQELVTSLARRFMPRRSAGDYLNLKLSAAEFMVLAVMSHKARQGTAATSTEALVTEIRPALVDGRSESIQGSRKKHRDAALKDGTAIRHRAASLLATPAHEPSPALDITAKSSQPVTPDPATQQLRGRPAAMARLPNADETTAVDRVAPRRGNAPDAAELAVKSLFDKGILTQSARGVELRPSVQSFATNLSEKHRHTFVRFDFSDDEWFMRETSFLATDGSLYVLTAEESGLSIVELDGKRLETWLHKAVGPMPELSPEEAPGKSARDFILRA